MARELIELELPTGEIVDFDVPAGLSDTDIQQRAVVAGLFEPAPVAPVPEEGAGQPVLEDAPAFNEASKPETEPAPSLVDRFVRQQELGTRAIALGNPLTLANDILGSALNVIPGVDLEPARALIDRTLDEQGLAAPETEGERIASRAVEFGAGTVLGIGAAATLPARAAATLTKGIGTQVAASTAAGTATQVAAEQGVGPWGQLLVGLVGGVGGGVAGHSVLNTASAKKLGLWADARMTTGTPMTPTELSAVTKANGLDMSTEELGQLSDAMNKLGNSAKVEAATVDLIHNPKTAMSITDNPKGGKRALTKEEKAIRKDIRKVFEVDADDADFYARIAREQDATRDARKAAVETEGLDRVRAREYLDSRNPLPTRPVDGAEAARMRALSDKQDSILAELELKAAEASSPSVANTRAIGDVRRAGNEAEMGDVLLANKDTIRNKKGQIRGTQTFGQKLIKRVHQISPRLAIGMRQVETTANRATSATLQAMPKFLTDPAITKAFKKNGEFRRAVSNMDRGAMERIVPGSVAALDSEVVPVLLAMKDVRKANGLSVLDDMFPRAVRSVSKVRKAMGREDLNKLDEMIRAKEKELGRMPNEDETAGIIGQLVGGRVMKQDRSRRIREVNQEAEKFYVNPRSALIDAVQQFEKAKAKQSFFKNTLGEELPMYGNLSEGSIGSVLQRSMDAGTLSSADVHEAARLVSTFYGNGQRAPSEAVRLGKDAITFSTLGFNPFATITQVGDLFINTARFGSEALTQLLPGRGGKIAADAYNTGVRELSSEMRTQQGFARAVRRGLKQFGFEAMDKKFSSTGTKAAYAVRQKQAKSNPAKAREELSELFGDKGALAVIEDLNAGRTSDRIAALIANDVADIRPQGGLDLPVSYSKYPNGRLAYSLLSWSINQVNFVRNNAVHVIERGIQKNDGKMIAKGAKTLALMTALFAAGGGTATVLKDVIRTTISGEQFEPGDSFAKGAAAGAIPLGMSGKFLIEGLQSGRKGVLDTLPASSLLNQAAGAMVKFAETGEISALMKGTTLGKNIHDLATGVNLIDDAGAGTKQFKAEDIKAVSAPFREAGPSAPLQSGPLPPGTQDLLAERSQTDVDIARLHQRTVQEINAERAQEVPPPSVSPPSVSPPKSNKLADQMRAAKELLVVREGDESATYQNEISDGKGGVKLDKPTGGIGHVLTKAELKKYPVGTEIEQDVRDAWYKKDVAKSFAAAHKQAKAIGRPDMVWVLTSVNFQLGTNWFKDVKLADGATKKGHTETWKLLKEGKWEEAAVEAANSKWARQTSVRVEDFQEAIRSL